MPRTCVGLSWIAVVVATLSIPVPGFCSEGVAEVTVRGEGPTEEAALFDALQRALKQGAAGEISSRKQAENFELIREMIHARADTLARPYEILERGDTKAGNKFCKVKASVNGHAVAAAWDEVRGALAEVGRPGVVVYIEEWIDGVRQDNSILQSLIEIRLRGAGFTVHAGQKYRAMTPTKVKKAPSQVDVLRMQTVAKNFGAQLFISGIAQANAAGLRDLDGEATAMYEGEVVVELFYTETAERLANETLASWQRAARGHRDRSRAAGKKALAAATDELIERVQRSVMRHWATRIITGHELTLYVTGLEISDATEIKKKLNAMDPQRVRKVNFSMTTEHAWFRIKTTMTAEELIEHLADDDWSKIIDLIDRQDNLIRARMVKP